MSDYEVSPLGMSTALLGSVVRVAVLARTSTEDQQDPRQSIMRQVGNCRTALPGGWMELDQRGRGNRLRAVRHPGPA